MFFLMLMDIFDQVFNTQENPNVNSFLNYKSSLQYNTQTQMFSIHNRVFNEEDREDDRVSRSGSNKMILKRMLVYSPQSSIMMVIILVMFILCEITDLVKGKYNLSVVSGSTLLKYGANASSLVNQGQYWRLFTAMFLHAGIIHLFSNSTSFFLYLMPVEKNTKSIYIYFAVLIGGGMLGNILSVDVHNIRQQQLLAVGASTAICSVIGFDFAYRILRVDERPLDSRRIVISLTYIFLISIMPGVDFFGHFGSLFGGFLIGMCALKPSQTYWNNSWRKILRIGGIITLSAYTTILIGLLIKYHN